MFWLASFFLFTLLPVAQSFYLADSNPILAFSSQVREGHLYTENHRRGMYLQISQDGSVSGSDVQTPYSALQLQSVQPGHIAIKGQRSSLFLCTDSGGSLRGQSHFSEDDCTFQELLLADGYTRFLSPRHGFPLSLASRRSPDRHLPFTRFLPLKESLPKETASVRAPIRETYFNLDSDDLLGMSQGSVLSPQFSVEK
ncbi:fibroblast growth factor 21 [Corythoichthys intestinalis]|uniref:fibroblast growth factor 21 n=1 Tax=Corythoichthys intestinalis TaxID=161448 RepID=UPI0025A627D1|nr:fibroblast growth factor 21 [Corythoichthys intestinalis]XP_061807668.1 fibroblast growth factor 21 [Nerophis lumbriciformis]